jgi:FixJ family two-component response regulator
VVGHSVESFASGAKFLASNYNDLTCLVLDHHMTEMTGLELAEKLRTEGAKIPILLVTGSPSPAIVTRAAELGIDKVLEKPPTDDEILDFIEAH